MKRTLIVIMAVCTALIFTACGKSSGNTETVPVESESGAEEPTTEQAAEPSKTQGATLEAPGSTAEFKILLSRVVEISDTLEDMTIKNGDKDVKIDLDGVVVETSYALDAGTPVSVVYKGEISGDDASNAKIVMVLDAQKDMEVKTITGSVMDQAMSTFVIQSESKDEISFMKNNCEGLDSGVLGQATDDSNGSGAKVTVTYVTVTYDAGSEANFPLKVEAAE